MMIKEERLNKQGNKKMPSNGDKLQKNLKSQSWKQREKPLINLLLLQTLMKTVLKLIGL